MLQGIGDMYIRSNDLGSGVAVDQRLIELNLLDFTYESEAETRKSQKQVAGVRRDQSSATGTITDTLTFRINDIDWGQLQFAMGNFAKTITNIEVPLLKYSVVPGAADSHTITDSDITAATAEDIYVYVNSSGGWGQPTPLAPAASSPPGPGEYFVDGAAGTITFNLAEDGATISYTVIRTYSTGEQLGGAGLATKLGSFSFRGKIYSTKPAAGYYIDFPMVTLDGRPSLDFSADVPQLEITATPATPNGWDEPFRLINAATLSA